MSTKDGCEHHWLVVAGVYISSGVPGQSKTTDGYKLCDKCGATEPWPPKDGSSTIQSPAIR